MLQKVVEAIGYFFRKNREKLDKQEETKESKQEQLHIDLVILKVEIGKLQAQMDIVMKTLFTVQELQKDVQTVLTLMREKGLLPSRSTQNL